MYVLKTENYPWTLTFTTLLDQWALACVDSRANFLGDGRYGKLCKFQFAGYKLQTASI